MGVGNTLLLDVVVPEAHQNDHRYICTCTQQTYFPFTMQEFSMVDGYTENLNSTKLSKLGNGPCTGDRYLPGTIRYACWGKDNSWNIQQSV